MQLNITDLGIALGSAVSIAMDKRVDNRILYTAGQAILDFETFGRRSEGSLCYSFVFKLEEYLF